MLPLRLLSVLLFVTASLAFSVAQGQKTESYDILTFKVPQNWVRNETDRMVEYTATNTQTSGYAKFSIFRSIGSSGQIDNDFDLNWKSVIEKNLIIKGKPEISTERRPDGWQMKSGTGIFSFNGVDNVAILLTYSDLQTQTCVVLMMNTAEFESDLDSFLGSIRFQLTSVKKSPPTPVSSAGQWDRRLIGRWQRSGSAMLDIGNPGYWGSSGYDVSRYEFFSDGTYTFKSRSFRMVFDRIIIVNEKGTFSATNKQLLIKPAQSVIQSYAKREGRDELGKLIRSENRSLEQVNYAYTFHYFSGIQEWNLVLQASKPTQRDGEFSSNKLYPNAWYFDQKFTGNDPTAPVYHK